MASLPPVADDTLTTTTSGAPRTVRLVRLAPTGGVAKERRRSARRIGIAALVAKAHAEREEMGETVPHVPGDAARDKVEAPAGKAAAVVMIAGDRVMPVSNVLNQPQNRPWKGGSWNSFPMPQPSRASPSRSAHAPRPTRFSSSPDSFSNSPTATM